jgi:alpha-L-rhamnosidase
MAFMAMSLLTAFAAESKWIGPMQGDKWKVTNPVPCFVKTFKLDSVPRSAVAKIAAAGWFELRVNGKKAGKHVLEPVTCQPDKRILEITHDIAPLLKKGDNEIEILVANGWFGCSMPKDAWGFWDAVWHKGIPPCVKAVFSFDGKDLIATGGDWQVYDSAIVFSALRCGEQYDARLEGKKSNLRAAAVLNKVPSAVISENDAEPCKLGKLFEPQESFNAKDGGVIYDFRHNIAGWCEIEVEGEAGAVVYLDHDESIKKNKTLLRNCQRLCDNKMPYGRQHDVYILSGKGKEKWHPRFVYHGFRYVQVKTTGKVKVLSIRAREVSSFLDTIGSITTSDRNFTRLQSAMRRSYEANFVGIPTDCPHREQNGWTGDAQLACETGLWNYDAIRGYVHFIRMMIDAQKDNGAVPCIVPCTHRFGYKWGTGPAWDVAIFEIPKRVYWFYGDDSLAKETYATMKKYISFAATKAGKDGLYRYGLADWCPLRGTHGASNKLTDSAYVWYMHKEMAFWAERFGEKAFAKEMLAKAEKIRAAFNKAFYKGNGVYDRICKNKPGEKRSLVPLTSLAAPLYFKGLCADGEEQKVAKRLVEEVRRGGWKCFFGIFGSKWVPRVLAEYGYQDDAWKLLTKETGGGFMNFLRHGYDCLWETFDGGASRNHIMFGDFSAWGYEYVAGIVPLEPGFKKVAFRPHFIEGVDSFEASHKTKYGVIKAGWKRDKSGKPVFKYEVPDGIEVVK